MFLRQQKPCLSGSISFFLCKALHSYGGACVSKRRLHIREKKKGYGYLPVTLEQLLLCRTLVALDILQSVSLDLVARILEFGANCKV